MTPVKGICTSCNKEIELDSSKDACICNLCGAPFVTQRAIDKYNTPKEIETFLSNNVAAIKEATALALVATTKEDFMLVLRDWAIKMLSLAGESCADGTFANKDTLHYEKHGYFWGRAITGDVKPWQIRFHMSHNRPWRPSKYDLAPMDSQAAKDNLFNTRIKHYIWEGLAHKPFSDYFVQRATKDGVLRFMSWCLKTV